MSLTVLKPTAVTAAILVLCDVPEDDYSAWDSTKVYSAAGTQSADRCIYSNSIWQSVVGTSATVTMTIASPAVVTWTAHGLAAGTAIRFETTASLPTGVTAGQTYYVISTGLSTNSFQFSTTVGGAAVNTSGSQSGTHTGRWSTNVNQTPSTTNTSNWSRVSATNRWKCLDTSNGTQTVNRSSTVTISAGTPGSVSWTAHGLSADQRVVFTSTGDMPGGLSADVGYYVRNPTTDAFELAEDAGGPSLTTTTTGTGTITAYTASFRYDFTFGSVTNGLGLSNITGGHRARIVMTDPVEGVVHDEEYSLLGSIPEATWYSWFFGTTTSLKQLMVTDLPSFGSATVRVDVEGGQTLAVGLIAFGQANSIGNDIKYGARITYQDYSTIDTNDYGDTTFTVRSYAKNIDLSFDLANTDMTVGMALLESLRATPCLWRGIDDDSLPFTTYGYYENLEATADKAYHCSVNINIRGLT